MVVPCSADRLALKALASIQYWYWIAENIIVISRFDRMMSQKSDDIEKPYACPIKGCRKRYKNINGVKYHAKNGHKREAR